MGDLISHLQSPLFLAWLAEALVKFLGAFHWTDLPRVPLLGSSLLATIWKINRSPQSYLAAII